MNILEKYPIKASTTASRIIKGEAVVVLPDKSEVKVLNHVGSRIWELSDGKKTLQEIVDIIYNEFEQDKANVERDVLEFVSDLEKRGMFIIKANT